MSMNRIELREVIHQPSSGESHAPPYNPETWIKLREADPRLSSPAVGHARVDVARELEEVAVVSPERLPMTSEQISSRGLVLMDLRRRKKSEFGLAR